MNFEGKCTYQPKISIVIPVYNTEKYLKECIDSVINQTYRNIEIILVDDGSTDNSGRICDEYEKKDSRIIVIHKQNQGLAETRNNGIRIARGEYIMFVDSDDWIDDAMCETMMNALSVYKTQSVMCSYVREFPNRSLPKTVHPHDKIFDSQMLLRRLCGLVGEELKHPENLENYNTMWGKLYPTAVLKKITVIDNKLIGPSEDLLFNIDCFFVVSSMVYINQPLYHYRKNVVTSITGTYNSELEKQWDNLYDRIHNFIETHQLGNQYASALNNRIALNILGAGLNCISGNVNYSEKLRRLNKVVSEPRRKAALEQLQLKHMPIHWKLFYFSAKHELNLLTYVLLVVIANLKGKI